MKSYSADTLFPEERKALGETIKKLRESKKMTQEDLADVVDMNVSYIAKIENGYVNTSVRNLIKIAKGLKEPVSKLFDF